MSMIFDTHAHYDDAKFDEDREEILGSLVHSGIGTVVNVGCTIESSKTCMKLAAKYPFIYSAIGVHPSDIDCLNEETFAWLKAHLHDEKNVALGEIGLDYYWEKEEAQKKKQRMWFERQFLLAKEEGMPVIIHSRDAAEETYDLLSGWMSPEMNVVIHCYSYSPEMAERFLKLGCYIGIGGVVTFKKSKKLKDVAVAVPEDRLLLETDCPYLSPEPNRGKRNSSLNLPYVVREIATLRGISEDALIEMTEKNARRFYQLED